jgi:hypothetical protein
VLVKSSQHPGQGPRITSVVTALLCACGGTDEPSYTPDAQPQLDATTVTRVGGVIALEERASFCSALASCDVLAYEACRDAVDDTTTVQFAIAGCASDSHLEAAIACIEANPSCGSDTCDVVVQTWAEAFVSPACKIAPYSVGIGDRYPIGASDSTCDGGLRSVAGWCTRACSTPQQCAGTGSDARNHFGTQNTCAKDTLLTGFSCYPTCTSTRDCQAWFGETRQGLRVACKQFDDGSAPVPICVRVNDNRGVELP